MAWRVITYEKGSWIIHMLRRRLGDDRFLAMLGELRKRYQFRTMTTDDLRLTAAESLPAGSFDPRLEAFFEQWVYSTGIPALKMQYTVQGKGSGAARHAAPSRNRTRRRTSVPGCPSRSSLPKASRWCIGCGRRNGRVPFSVAVRQTPSKVLLDPASSVLHK